MQTYIRLRDSTLETARWPSEPTRLVYMNVARDDYE
nr:MAG TPA: hypothetical protein [Caudoviricetes sp.]